MYRIIISVCFATMLFACKENTTPLDTAELDAIAEQYVRLALEIGQYDEAFVDAYYGPDSLRPTVPKQLVFPKDSLLGAVRLLVKKINGFAGTTTDSISLNRAFWLEDQLKAFSRRIQVFSGETGRFDEESKDLFGAVAPIYTETDFEKMILRLDTLLPGEGSVASRFQTLANNFIIPKEKLDTVFKACIATCRERTLKHFSLPDNEDFTLEFVTNKSWNGYNWYKGNYQSLIQINTDLDIFIDRAIDVGSHESYPGHHVYNMLLEKNLYADRGRIEMSVYPLFSPQSFIAEGTANYGIDVVFPGNDRVEFCKNTLLPLADLDTTGITLYFKAMSIKGKLNYVRNEVARLWLAGNMDEQEALRWLQEYGLYNEATALKSLSFIRNYRSYVINYNYGMDVMKHYVETRAGKNADPEAIWKEFGKLMSAQVRISELIEE